MLREMQFYIQVYKHKPLQTKALPIMLILPSDIGVGLDLGLALVSRSLLYNWLFHPAVRC